MTRIRRSDRLAFAAVLPDKIRSRGASGHFASERLKSPPRLALAIVHQPDRGILRHRSADNRRGIFADRLIDIIFAIVLAANRPSETDRSHRAGADLVITARPRSVRERWASPQPRPFLGLAIGFRVIEDAGNRGERVIGRVAFAQNVSPPEITQSKRKTGTPLPVRMSFPRSRMRLSFVGLCANRRQFALPGPLLLKLGRQTE